MSKAKVAVIGSGYWGKNLVRNFHSLGSLKLICDKSEDVLTLFQVQYPEVKSCLAYMDILASDEVMGVVIATPAETHYRLAREALLAGKHVYVEKPLVLDEAEGKDLIDLARERGLVLMVGHLLQYHPAFVKLKELVLTGELGRINYIYSNRLNLGKIRREENALWSFAPHDVSMILTLAGEEPESVMATGGNYLHREIADVTNTHIDFPSGLKAHIFVSWLHPFKEQKLVVVGDRKMAVFDDTKPWKEKLVLYPHKINWENRLPIPDKADAELVELQESEPLKTECEHFIKCMESAFTPITDGQEGLRVLRVLNLAQRSLNQGGVKQNAKIKEKTESDVHESAYVDDAVTIGSGTKVWHFTHIMRGSTVGKECRIGQNVSIGPDVVIGDHCKIQNNVSIYKGVTLENDVFCGPSMVFTNVYNPRCEISRINELRKTLVQAGATLGANCTIVCGTSVGRYAFVGAGAVVTKDVPAHALVMGVPARQTGWMCECGISLDDNLRCPTCGTVYQKIETGLSRSN